jgi:16S rRNA (guanine966-N2)-methyltransferase
MNIISGTYKNRKIRVPKGSETRPTSSRLRETLFNICQGYVEDTDFLDLFAGSGAVGLEALSRGAKNAIFVDSSTESIRCIKDNVALLGVEKASEIFHADVFKALEMLKRHKKQFDIIYADPPYDHITHTPLGPQTYSAQLVIYIDNLIAKNQSLLLPEGDLFIEDSNEALKNISSLQHLILKSSRQMGRSALHHYITRK